jgi:hypothetical protein
MNREDLRAYAQRAWHVAETLKQEHWAREVAARGPLATFEASEALWEHMRSLRPDWPSPDERREDLAHHIALKQLIDRAAGAFEPPWVFSRPPSTGATSGASSIDW